MKNSKKQLGNQKNNLPAKQVILKLQLNGLQLEITSQNEQYSPSELTALLGLVAECGKTLFSNSVKDQPAKNQSLSENDIKTLKSLIHSEHLPTPSHILRSIRSLESTQLPY